MCDPDTEAILGAPGVYSFATALHDAEARGASPTALAQLRIFCAGTWADYAAAGLPALSPAAAAKLRQLTIASLAARSPSRWEPWPPTGVTKAPPRSES